MSESKAPVKIRIMSQFPVFLLIALLFSSLSSRAVILREDIGELKIQDLLLRPTFKLQEPSNGAFSIGESSFALRWELEEKFAGVVRIGPRTLLNPLAHYSSSVNSDLMLVEAYAEYNDPYGRFRLGRVPIEFGYEGRLWERELVFPRSLLFQNRIVMLRDVGGSYEISHNNFFSGFVVHNGESDRDEDGRIWYTARLGFRDEKFEIGLAGQTGGTKPIATSSSSDTLAGVDPNKEAKWRIMGLYTAFTRKRWEWVIEAYMGEREQDKKTGRFSTGHTDFGYQFLRTFSAHLRYDQFDPNQKISGDLQRQVSVAAVFSNKTHSSNLILVGSKVLEEKKQVPNDQVMLIWSLSPSGVVRF